MTAEFQALPAEERVIRLRMALGHKCRCAYKPSAGGACPVHDDVADYDDPTAAVALIEEMRKRGYAFVMNVCKIGWAVDCGPEADAQPNEIKHVEHADFALCVSTAAYLALMES